MRTREEAERLAAIEGWLVDPFTQRLVGMLKEEEEYWNEKHRGNIRIPGNPYATAENHAWTDGVVEATRTYQDWFLSPEAFAGAMEPADD